MTLWWILDLVLLLVVVPIVVVLLNNVLKEAKGIVPSVNRIKRAAQAGIEGPRRRTAAADHADAGPADGRERRRVRRFARRDPGRRLMPAPGVLLLITVVLIVLALVYFLVSTIFALKQIADGLDETIAAVGEIIAKTEPVGAVVDDINANLDAAVDALEGLLVKKAGMEDSLGLVEGIYPGAKAEGLRNFPDSASVRSPRIGEVYTRGTLTLARLGREAPIAAASPTGGPVLRNVRYGLAERAAALRGDRPGRSPIIGTNSPVQYEAHDADPSAV
jgi:hypothetical protein